MHVGGLPWPKGGACTRCRTLLRSLPVGWEVELGDVLDGPAQSVTMLPKSLQVAFSGMLLCSSKELCRSILIGKDTVALLACLRLKCASLGGTCNSVFWNSSPIS